MKHLPLICTALLVSCSIAHAQHPTVADDRLVIELVAQEPDIVTPTGIAVDERGRIWCIENNTHQRPSDYKGHPSDRIRIYDDFDPHGRARRVKTFADGFKNSMGLALHYDGRVFLATRSEIFVLRDTKGTDTADEKKSIIKLDTKGDYPHNGLSGFAFDALGQHVFRPRRKPRRIVQAHRCRRHNALRRRRRRQYLPLPARWHQAYPRGDRLLEPIRDNR
jgi:hypothetical protein